MGVPGLWPFINGNFGRQSVVQITKYINKSPKKIDYLYLDANGLLHGAAQTVFNYGTNKSFIDALSHLTYEQKLTRTFELFFENIIDVTKIVTPQRVLYIAIDGPAPRAKQNQQRERRFVSAMSRNPASFDSNSISPGTEFMHKLSQFMYFKIRDCINSDRGWRNVDVIYSPPTIPGEGEHKIMDYIRALPNVIQTNYSHCMFGPDGDLIMLTLSAHVNNIYLLRESHDNAETYDLTNMTKVREELAYVLNQNKDVKRGNRTYDDVSNDFVLMGFFVGNDFLPKIKMFFYLADGLNHMISTAIKIYQNSGNYITKGNQINIEGFKEFVKELSKYEEYYIIAQNNIKHLDNRFNDETLMSCFNDDGKFDKEKYKEKYYSKFCNNESLEIEQICRSYFKNLAWVFNYYTKELPSWDQSYNYHYAPLMSDLSDYLSTLTQESLEKELIFEKSHPALPFEQLLCILPESSKNLLPEYYQPLMYHKNSPIVKNGYYPSTFKIDYEGKRKEYQGIPILPFVDYEIVKNAYRSRKNGMVFEGEDPSNEKRLKWHRNEYGNVFTFRYTHNYRVIYKSPYGTIENCRVKRV